MLATAVRAENRVPHGPLGQQSLLFSCPVPAPVMIHRQRAGSWTADWPKSPPPPPPMRGRAQPHELELLPSRGSAGPREFPARTRSAESFGSSEQGVWVVACNSRNFFHPSPRASHGRTGDTTGPSWKERGCCVP